MFGRQEKKRTKSNAKEKIFGFLYTLKKKTNLRMTSPPSPVLIYAWIKGFFPPFPSSE